MSVAHPYLRGIVRLIVVLAILAVGYGVAYLAPAIHATASSAAQYEQLAIQCPSVGTHC